MRGEGEENVRGEGNGEENVRVEAEEENVSREGGKCDRGRGRKLERGREEKKM